MSLVIRDINLLTPVAKSLCERQIQLIEFHKLPFALFETLRSKERQAECFANGSSKVIHSNHEDGVAWDMVVYQNGKWSWSEEDIYWYQILVILTLKLIPELRSGADWNGKNFWFDERFKDFAHWELK